MAKGDRFVVLTMDKQTGNAGGLDSPPTLTEKYMTLIWTEW